jgi:esterase/lipase superfamily enzyme
MPLEAYGEESRSLFENLPVQLKSSDVDILYATDRAPDSDQEILLYGNDRSFSLAFGFARVNLGKDLSRDDLVAWSQSKTPEQGDIEPSVASVADVSRLA